MSVDQKAGGPGPAGVRELASTELAALTRDLCNPYEEWRTTVLSFRKALAGLERLCDAATGALPEDDSKRVALAGSLVDKLVAAAAAESEAAAQRVRTEAEAVVQRTRAEAEALVQEACAESEALAQRTRAEAEAENLRVRAEAEAIAERARTEARADVARAEDANRRLQDELQAERGKVKAVEGDLQAARHARAQVESQLEESKVAHQNAVAELEAQVQSTQAELDAERTEVVQLKRLIEAEKVARSKLLDALQTVQRAVGFNEQPPAADNAASTPATAPAPSAKGKAAADASGETVNRPLKLIKTATAEIERELTEYVKQLFEQIQLIYVADSKSTEDSAMVVDRLTANLRHAHSVFSRRLESSNIGESKVFEEQLALLLDAQSQTAFGRHLAIAAYSYAPASAEAEAS